MAFAQQTAPEETSDESGEIVVTAQRREELLSRVPISVQAVTPTELQTAGVATPLDLPNVVPGLTTSPGATAGAFFTPFIRGVGANSTAIGNDPSVALFIDGIYQSDKAANVFEMADLQRIEVLRGPQGTLFGRNATGGAVNIVTRRPSPDAELNAEVSYGNYDATNARVYATGGSDTVAASIAATRRDGFDYFTVLGTGEETGGLESTTISGQVLFTPTSNFEALLGLNWMDNSTNVLRGAQNMALTDPIPVGVFFGGTAAPDPYTVTEPQLINRIENSGLRASLRMRYSMPNVDLVSTTGASDLETLTTLDYDATDLDVFFFDNPGNTKDWSQEFQLLSTSDGPLQWVAGVYYLHNESEMTPLTFGVGAPYPGTDAQVLATPGASRIQTFARGPIDAWAVYAQGTYQLTDATRLTAGVRYTSEERNFQFEQYGIGQLTPMIFLPAQTLLATDDQSETFEEPSWRIALDHTFREGLMGYLSYNRGFKSGTFNLNDFCPGQTPVESEILDAYEAGLKGRWPGGLTVDTSVFYYDYQNIQVTRIAPSSCGATSLQNAGGEEIYGLDVDLGLRPTDNLRLSANISLLHAEYSDFSGASGFTPGFVGGTAITLDATGEQAIYSPDYSFTLGADYTIPLQNQGSVNFNASYFYTDGYKTVVGDGNYIDPYGQLSAAIQYNAPGDNWYARLWGRNLTDEDYVGRNLNAFGSPYTYVDPMSYGVAVGVNLN
ncbi:TonB-dependent receptor [Terricaulis silvestris]|nr:TonB-dependent receptor [Terricaulis silvestris]